MKIKAPAKLNLSLNIFPKKRTDGLYPVKFLNCQLELADEIEIQSSNKSQVVSSPKLDEKSNLVYRAIHLLPKKKGVKIHIKKKIPIKAGLGGGSSDAAAVLNYLNRAWRLNLASGQLLKISQKLGMDVCYCLIGGLCLVEGAGEKIKKLEFSLLKLAIIIIVPQETKPSTAWAYQSLDLKKIGQNEEKLTKLIQGIKAKNIQKMAESLHNDFEYSISTAYPIVARIKKELLKTGALNAMLCGSGLAVFGIYENKKIAHEAYNELERQYQEVFLTETK